MSQYTLKGQTKWASCGHDQQLSHVFLTIFEGEDTLYTSLSERRGGLDLDAAEAKLQAHGLPMPAALKEDLLRDLQSHNPRNHTGTFTVEEDS